MNNEEIIEMLKHSAGDAEPLDPARLVARGRQRRTRYRIAAGTASASVAVAGVAALGFAAAAGAGGNDVAGTAPAGSQAEVAAPVGSSSTPSGGPSTVPGRSASTERVSPAPTPKWLPGGPIGARPIGTIPRSGKVEIAKNYWFETRGTSWCITAPADGAAGTYEPFGCRRTVGNENLGDVRSPGMQGAGDRVTSVFKGDVRRVIYSSGDVYVEAKVYRLAAIPGWVLSIGDLDGLPTAQRPGGQAVFGFDAAGRLIAQFPEPRDGGPATNPLGAPRR